MACALRPIMCLDRYILVAVYNLMESTFAIIAEPNRRAILSLLATSERSVGDIEEQLRLSHPSVSKHLRALRDAGCVAARDVWPGPAAGAEVRGDGERGTLILVRELRHPPAKVWQALTDPTQLREWAPFDADRSLASVGSVSLSTVGTPTPV